jgi:tetratricopeptide (TPR) repeat protein
VGRIALARRLGVAVAGLAILFGSLVPAAAHDGLHEQIAAVTQEIAASPKDALLYLKRGELYRVHRDWERAASDYDTALRLDPALSAVYFARGRMLLESGRPAEAKVALDLFLGGAPDNGEALVERARAFVALNRARDAAADYTRAIEVLPTPDPAHYSERASTLAGVGFVDEAIRGLDAGIAKIGPIVTLELHAIELERGAGRYDAALARVEVLASASPRKESWHVLRGEILAQAGRSEDARCAFADALESIAMLQPDRRSMRAMRDLDARARRGMGCDRASAIGDQYPLADH